MENLPVNSYESISQLPMTRRNFLISAGAVGMASILVLYGCSPAGKKTENVSANIHNTHNPAEIEPNLQMLDQAGLSLINMHEESMNGWRFKSAIQSPHYQTDRDVGASGVGMGFLVMADRYPNDPQWLQAAEKTADWLKSVAHTDKFGNLYWSDYVDDNETSDSNFTSFDDGTIGIGDYFWQLYEKTNNQKYKDVALSSLRWTFAQAENIGGSQPTYRWRWDVNDKESGYNMGMGMGAVGLVHSFATYYQRLHTSDPNLAAQCRQYIDGSLRYIDSVRAKLGNNDGDARALPETGVVGQDGDTAMNSGYLSGAAGAAFMYLKLYNVFGDQKFINKANAIFSWLENTNNGPMVKFGDDKVAWKLTIDPQGGDDPALATGFEEGSAGIGWVYLQAYNVTGNEHYLSISKKAANWLNQVAVKSNDGATWHEDESPTNSIVHANLNNGAAGIGMFLNELSVVSKDQTYQLLAKQALKWIEVNAVKTKDNNIYWMDNDGEKNYSKEPSWHWGTAGIIAFAANMSGGKINIPGQQPTLKKST